MAKKPELGVVHAKTCDCAGCAERRVNAKLALWKEHGGVAPLDPDKTVFVRSFWRHQKNHLNKQPNSKKVLVEKLRALARLGKKENAA